MYKLDFPFTCAQGRTLLCLGQLGMRLLLSLLLLFLSRSAAETTLSQLRDERQAHTVPEELFLRPYLVFPGMPIAFSAVCIPILHHANPPHMLRSELICVLCDTLQAYNTSSAPLSLWLQLDQLAGAALASRQARLAAGRYQLPPRVTCSSFAGPGFCVYELAAELFPGKSRTFALFHCTLKSKD